MYVDSSCRSVIVKVYEQEQKPLRVSEAESLVGPEIG